MHVFLIHSFPRIFSNLVQTACCMYFKTDIQNYTSYKLQSLAFLAVSELKSNFSFEVYTYFWLCCSELAGLPCSFMIHTIVGILPAGLIPKTTQNYKPLWVPNKVIYTKYSKHLPYTVAHTLDCVCRKMLIHGLNHGFFLSLFKLISCPML